jgi:hypothetical protein
VHQRINGHTYLMRKISSDGVHWGSQTEDPGQALFNVTDYELLSPAVLKIGATYWMWSVSLGSRSSRSAASKVQYRTSADGINWSSPLDAHLTQDGYIPWHVDVIQVAPRNEFWMLFCAFPLDSRSNNTVLFFAKSTDGVNWTTYGRAALSKGTGPAWDRGQIYRSTLLYNADHDLLKVWYSANDGSAWHLGFTQSNYTKFLNRLVAQAANGITSPKSGATVGGEVVVMGYASSPRFEKWQLDLLPGGNANSAIFLALGTQQGVFTYTLDSTLYSAGNHVLRLRLVRTDSNYDEYPIKITIAK